MLVLSRRKNEAITIHDDISITVIDIQGDKVRLGITAPKDVPVHRKEVYDAIRRGQSVKCLHEFPVGACPHADCTHARKEV